MKLFGSEKTPEEKLTTDLIGNFWYPGRFPPEFNRLERKRVYYAVEDAFKRGKSCDEIQKAYDDIISEVKDERKVSKENEISNNSLDPNVIQYNDEFQQIIAEGYLTNVYLPEVETVSHGMLTKGVATGVFGLVGLAMTMGSSTKQRKIRTIVRIPENGIVIEQGTVEGRDIKIPWENILGATTNRGVAISLVDGSVIEIGPPVLTKGFLFSIGHPDDLINFINDHAAGQVEEGW